jgi:hypothetical protein
MTTSLRCKISPPIEIGGCTIAAHTTGSWRLGFARSRADAACPIRSVNYWRSPGGTNTGRNAWSGKRANRRRAAFWSLSPAVAQITAALMPSPRQVENDVLSPFSAPDDRPARLEQCRANHKIAHRSKLVAATDRHRWGQDLQASRH